MPRVNLNETMSGFFHRTQSRYWGLGVMIAWVYCTWFSDGIFAPDAADAAHETLLISLLFSIVCLFAMAFRPGRERPLPSWAVLISAGMLTLTTLLFFWLPAGLPADIAAALGGLFGSVMWIAWGELFCQLEPEDRESAIPASLLAFIVATALVYVLPAPISGVLAALYPAVSCIMLFLCRSDVGGTGEFPPRKQPVRTVSAPLCGLAACALVCAAATGFVMATAELQIEVLQGSGLILVYVVGGFLALSVALYAVAHTSHMNFSFLYEWAIPLIVFSLSLSVLQKPFAGDVAMVLACGSAIFVDVLFYVIFARITSAGVCYPSETFGLFRGAVQLGFLLGSMAGAALRAAGVDCLPWALLLICACVVMLPLFVHLQARFEPAVAPAAAPLPQEEVPGEGEGKPVDDDAAGSDAASRVAAEYRLSPREAEILQFLGKGRSVPYMREVLVLSKSTIETHIKHIYAKTGVHSKQELLDLLENS